MAGKRTLLLVAGAVVAATGAVAAYLYFQGTPGKKTNLLESAKLVPSGALMTTFISTDSNSWSKLQQFGTPEAQQVVAQGLAQGWMNFQSQMFGDTNVDFEKDLKPWVGGVTFAWMPSVASSPSQESNVLMVVGIQNKLKALEFANRMKSQKQAKVEEKPYKGITISSIKEQSGNGYNTAVLGDHLVLATQKTTVEQAIDTFQGKPSFASVSGVSKAMASGAEVQNPLAQIYLNNYAALMQELIATTPDAKPLPPATMKQFQQVKSIVMGLGVDNQGLRLKAIASLEEQAIKYEFKPVNDKVVGRFPVETVALVGGTGIGQSWSQIVAQSKDAPDLQASVDQVRQSIKQAVNLDADKEVFGWMNGEFALALISSNQGILTNLGGVGAALILETSDRPTAEATLNKLDALIKRNTPSIAIEPRDIQGIKVQEWKVQPYGTVLGHGWLDNNSMFVAIGPLVEAIATKPSNPLNNSPNFKAAIDSLPKSHQGYFYLDMDRTMSVVNPFLQTQGGLPPQTTAVVNSIRGIGMTATLADKSTSKMEMLLSLKPKSK